MRRSSLITISALGLVICLLGGTGLFAALTDTATTGTNTVESGAQAGSVDLQLAVGASPCGTFTDDLASGLFTYSGLVPGGGGPQTAFCIKNAGSQVTAVTVRAFALEDTEVDCTGDEEDYGDATCGSGVGELSAVVDVRFDQTDCDQMYAGIVVSRNLAALVDEPLALADLAPDVPACYAVGVSMASTYPATALQIAQSDQTTWRFQFDGSVAP